MNGRGCALGAQDASIRPRCVIGFYGQRQNFSVGALA